MSQHPVNSSIPDQALEGRMGHCAENYQLGIAPRGQGKNLDNRVAVQYFFFDSSAIQGTAIRDKIVKFIDNRPIQIARRAVVPRRVHGRQHMQQDQFGLLTCCNLTGKRCVRARGLSQRSGVQHRLLPVAAA
jgi:hypothetical protein